jgi:hypothetical protein
MEDLADGDRVWVKRDNKDTSKPGTIRYRAEEPDSYWVEVQGKLLRRSRAYLRKRTREAELQVSKTRTEGAKDTTIKVAETPAVENRQGKEPIVGARESGRVRKKKRDPDYMSD